MMMVIPKLNVMISAFIIMITLQKNELELGWMVDGEYHWAVNVCEVYVEEI